MSGIGAIFQFDGGPVDSGALSRMAVHLKPRGPDGVRTWTTPGIGLVHAHFWTTPEDVGEEQPICSPCGRHWIVADARLDNRDDLLAALDSVTRSSTDAEIILAAYDKWGDDCGAKLEGDFGFVIWDAPQRRVLAVREPIGTRLLHYASVPGGLVIGSTSGAVVAALDRVPDQNRPYIHDYLQGRMSRWTTETPHQGVFRLMQSYALTATASGYRTRRYYVIGESRPEPWRNREEAAEQFTALFERAVRATLRIRTPAAILLSGGLDSSAIACQADKLIAEGKAAGPLSGYSAVFPRTPTADERQYLDAVLQSCETVVPILVPSDDCGQSPDPSDYPQDELEWPIIIKLLRSLLLRARQDGQRVMLNGIFGDQVLGGGVYCVPLTILDVGPSRWPSELPFYRRAAGGSTRRLLNVFARASLKTAARPLLAAEPLAAADLDSHCARHIYESFCRQSHYFVGRDVMGAYAGVEQRYPFANRRLLEFLIRVPGGWHFERGVQKMMLRDGLRGVLPESIRCRRGKIVFNDVFVSPFDYKKPTESRIVNEKYMSDRALQTRLLRHRQQGSYRSWFMARRLQAVERWLGGRERAVQA